MTDLLITNARLVNEGREFEGDLRIRGDRIDAIASGLTPRPGEAVVDAAGKWLLPGMIDDQVHFREPGLEYKADFVSESNAAVAGGVTSLMEMPNTRPATVDAAALDEKYRRAVDRMRTNYAFYLGATNDNIDEIRALDPLQAPGVKVFMGASTGNMLVDDPEVLDAIFRDAPTPIITHCEDTPTIEARLAAERERWGDDIPASHHADIRSREACYKSTQLAISLAKKHGSRLHVLHISTADELSLFEPGPVEGKRITAETCVHFLHFDRSDYDRLGHQIKCNPSIKEPADREALIRAVVDDRIDVIATDHAPHTWEEKQLDYVHAPSGLPLVQFVVVAALELVHARRMSVAHLVNKLCHAPAKLFDVAERGFLREGYFADLVLVEQDRPFVVERTAVLSKCGWSPFEGTRFRSRIAATYVNGEQVWDGDRLVGAARGRRLAFSR